jgi:uncharacterized protein
MAILLVSGYGGSGPDHWQTWFESQLPDTIRVSEINNTTLDLPAWAATVRWEINRASAPVWIVAHGFGCLAAVQAASDYSERVAGAMLVAPFDPDNVRATALLPETPLEFPSIIVSSTNNPHMRSDRAAFWAAFWNSSFVSVGAAGGIDPASGFGPWPQGLELLDHLKTSSIPHVVSSAGQRVARTALAV